jgi:hypothetical protein
MEYRTIVLKLDSSNRPPLQEGKISKHERGEYIRSQKEWLEHATEPVRSRARELGCVALSQLWATGEIVVAVPMSGFVATAESLRGVEGVVGYELYEPRTLRPEA